MILILEGPDGSGKSTLAKVLSKQTGYPLLHRSKPNSDAEKLAMMASYVEVASSGRNYIFDRCWYSEMIYGKVMRDRSYIDYGQMRELEELIVVNGGGLIIHCTDNTSMLWDRMNARGEDYIKSYADLIALKVGYEDLFHTKQHLIPVVRYELSKNLSGM